MEDRDRSPERRHILAAINPARRRSDGGGGQASPSDNATGGGENAEPPIKFRFKSKPAAAASSTDQQPRDESDDQRRRHHRHHHYRHRRRRRRRSASPPRERDVDDEEDGDGDGDGGGEKLDGEAAFRASLRDALADDEGAAYWEGVYGQPLHVYGRAGRGELERMTDDDYADYVRRRMWERTADGRAEVLAAKRAAAAQAARLRRDVDRSLRRGDARRAARLRRDRWHAYRDAWAAWDGTADAMAWPVESGRREHVTPEAVRQFFVRSLGLDPDANGRADAGPDPARDKDDPDPEEAATARLKDERVRWHPDKMQHRLGGRSGDEALVKDVTAVFQVIDALWAETRPKP